MTLYITTIPKYFPVASAIRDALVEKTNKKILISRNPEVIQKYGSVILNVGTTYSWIMRLAESSKLINPPEVCRISGDKQLTYETFKHYISTVEIKFGIPEKFPVIKRESLNEFHGKGITFVETPEEFGEEPAYYSEYIKFSAEYRVLIVVFGSKIKLMRVFRKDLKPEFKDSGFVPYNAEHCNYHLISEPKISSLPFFLDNIIMAMWEKRINNFYFGLDIGRVGSKLYLIETNSAPGMNSVTVDKFTNVLIEEGVF